MLNIIYMVLINVFSFFLYGYDKLMAIKGKRRIPEKRLIFFAVIGGAFGSLLAMLIFHHKIRKKKFYITVPAMVLVWSIVIWFCLTQNLHLTVSQYDYSCADVPAELDGYKIVQISDLHNQFYGPHEQILVKKIESLEPDIIFVTGDVVDSTFTNYDRAYEFFEGAIKIAPVFYVTGNHEARLSGEDFDDFLTRIKALGVNFLDNEKTEVDGYTLIGVADKSLALPPSELKETHPERLTVCLAHEPGYADSYQRLGADIVFSGHIHGGQFIIAGKGGFISPEFEFFPELYEGMHDFGDDGEKMTMFISRGLGNSVIPQRLNNFPEIVEVTLHK